MRAIRIVLGRELGAYLKSPIGYVIAAAALFLDGMLFQAEALGAGKRLSAQVLGEFFKVASGTTIGAAILLSIRLLAEERQNGTIVLLNTAPVRDVELVMGKFLSALIYLSTITLATIYMPLLVMVRGKITFGQVAVGYVGLFLIGAASLAIGLFASSLARQQLIAGVVGTVIVLAMLLLWSLAGVLSPPLKGVFASLAFHARHFQSFEHGVLRSRDVIYYLSVTYFFLLITIKATEARRWQ